MPENELAQYPFSQLMQELARRTRGKLLVYAETEQAGRDDPSAAMMCLGEDSVWALGAVRALDIHIDAKYRDAYIGDQPEDDDE